MRRTRRHGWLKFIVLLAALACAGTWAASQVRSVRDRSEVAKMTEQMKTVCVGRFLVDVPAGATVSLSHEMIGGFEIETEEETEAQFRARMLEREASIAARGNRAGGADEGGMVEARDLRVTNMVGRVFVYGHSRGYLMEGDRRIDMESVSVEAHGHLSGLSFTLSAKSVDEASVREAESLLARLHVREPDGIPEVPGFCIARAVFAEPLPQHTNENVTMYLGLPTHPDVALALFSIANARPGPGLLARAAEVDAASNADEILRIAKLRSDKRSINGIAGEEVAERVHEFNFTTGYSVNWEARGIQGDVLQPYMSFEMQAGVSERPGGQPVDASLHQDAVLALWDSISSTIRLRKSDPPTSEAAPEPAGPQLGATALAGEACPQSGWWECGVGNADMRVHRGQVQFVRQGERMPQPLLLPRQTVWQKFRGIQPSIEPDGRAAWQLVDKRARRRVVASVPLAPAGLGATSLDVSARGGRGTAVGSYVRTGEACPATGWWRCDEPHALDGTRWFAAGSSLPAATFQVRQGMFGSGASPGTIQRRSSWQLMRHAEAPHPKPDVTEPGGADKALPAGDAPVLS